MEPRDDTCCNCVEPMQRWAIQCSVCVDMNLCVDCFRCGAELGDHKRDHDYTVRSIGGPAIFACPDGCRCEKSWTLKEEMSLLDRVETLNLGDWNNVQQSINPNRTVEEISSHYEKCYLKGRMGKEILSDLSYGQLFDHTVAAGSSAPGDGKSERTCVGLPGAANKWNPQDLRLLAYMPRRDDFEKEFVNDAESLISNLTLISGGQELQQAVCTNIINMYIDRLNQRKRCKELINDYDLVTQFLKIEKTPGNGNYWKYSPVDIRRMKEERELKERLRWCCQFIPCAEFDRLILNLMKQKAVKSRIEELQQLCKNGIRSLKGKKEFNFDVTPRRRRKNKRLRFTKCQKRYAALS